MSLAPLAISAKQRHSIRDADGRVNIFEGAIRSGKTFSWLLLMLEKISTASTIGALVIIGKNRDSIYRNVFEPLFTWDVFALWRPFITYKQGGPTAQIFGRTIHVLGANDAKAESKIRGLTVLYAFTDEITVLDPNFFKQLLGRMSPAGAQLFGTTNPEGPRHWLKKDYLDRLDQLPDWRRFHFVIDDNPSLSDDYKRQIRSEYTGLWFKRYILGLWVAAEGSIYDMFDIDTHVIPWKDLPPMMEVIGIGVDYGTTNPTAAVILGLSAEKHGRFDIRHNLYVLDEWRYAPTDDSARWTDQKLSLELRAWMDTNHLPYEHAHGTGNVIVDPAAASFRVQLDADGIRTHPGENDVLYGIRTVSSLLSSGHLFLSDRCNHLVDEISGYAWDPKATEKGIDAPIKVADHLADALRYVIATTERSWRQHIDLAA